VLLLAPTTVSGTQEAAYTMKRHWNGLLRWSSKINNGILEKLNSLIQAAKAKAGVTVSSKI